MAPTAVFRCDASTQIGAGHVARCVALSEALKRHDWRCLFMGKSGTSDFLTWFGADAGEYIELEADGSDEPAEMADRLSEGCHLLAIDSYDWNAGMESPLRSWAERILVISDYPQQPHDCDYLVDTTISRAADAYEPYLTSHCIRLVGPGFALLRRKFAELRKQSLGRRVNRGDVQVILVSIGATDPQNHICLALEAVKQAKLSCHVDIAVAENAPHVTAVRSAISKLMIDATLHTNAEEMPKLLAQADVCIGAAGSSVLERFSLDSPTLALMVVDNQAAQAQGLRETKLAEVVGLDDAITVEALRVGLGRLIARRDDARPGAFGALECDGRGAARVAAHVTANVAARDSGPVTLRKANTEDARLMYDWQTMPEVRRVSRSKEFPPFADHAAWVRDKLLDPSCWLEIVEYRGRPAGIIRLDLEPASAGEGDAYEVSILVAPEYQGIGIGKAALNLARNLVPGADLVAFVLAGNHASFKLFETAGYVRHGDHLRCRAGQMPTAC